MNRPNPIGFRAPPEVRALLDRAAEHANRSMNSQLLFYLTQGLRLDGYKVPNPRKKQRPTGCNRQGVSVCSPERSNQGETHAKS